MRTTEDGTLRLHEELLLLSLRDEEGTIAPGTMYRHAIGGAIVAELLLESRIEVDASHKKKLVAVVDDRPVGDPLLDEALESIRDSKKPRSLQTWVASLASTRRLKHRVAERLCDRGILTEREGRVLLVFGRTEFPERDPRPERDLIERLRAAIFSRRQALDPRTVVLVALADASGLLGAVFDKKRLKDRERHIERIVRGEMTGPATRKAIETARAAVVVAAVMPAIIASSASS